MLWKRRKNKDMKKEQIYNEEVFENIENNEVEIVAQKPKLKKENLNKEAI